jgi:hypothetical protein
VCWITCTVSTKWALFCRLKVNVTIPCRPKPGGIDDSGGAVVGVAASTAAAPASTVVSRMRVITRSCGLMDLLRFQRGKADNCDEARYL